MNKEELDKHRRLLIDVCKKKDIEIKNLKEEIKRQEKAQVILDNQNADLQERINKAIEYIENIVDTGNCPHDIVYEDKGFTRNSYVNAKDIIRILKGEDNE